MAFASSAVSSTHTYYGNAEINFFTDDEAGLSVTIDTERLHMRSVQEQDLALYRHLFGDKYVMSKFATGQTVAPEEVQNRLSNVWVKRWHHHDPYTGLAVFNKDSDDFLGHVVLGHSGTPGESELAYLLHHEQWGKGYGSESAGAVVKEYAPATIEEGYLLNDKPLKRIVATARPDNPASCRILDKLGMHVVRVEEKYGALRHHYAIKLSELQEKAIEKLIPVGSLVKGKVTAIAAFGAFVDLDNGIEGLIHVSELSDQAFAKVEDVIAVDDEVTAKVLKLDPEHKKASLSVKAYLVEDRH